MASPAVVDATMAGALPQSSPETRPSPSSSKWNFPFAASPDIIRANQKDAYYQGALQEQLSTIARSFYGARFLHKYMLETKTVADGLYLALTTLRGARTLGEEYCDIVHVEGDTLRLPSLERRAGYILTTILTPYVLAKMLPKFRAKLRAKLDRELARAQAFKKSGVKVKIQGYVRRNLDALTSGENILAVHLGVFYFVGAYYHISKRLWGLRYIFTKKLHPHEKRAGYEVLGVLMLSQLLVQSYFHIQSTLSPPSASGAPQQTAGPALSPSVIASGPADEIRLDDDKVMPFIPAQSRKCTLCLEFMVNPTATGCGHVFCWGCVEEWCRGKPECPLCRQSCSVQHLLPLRP